MSRYEVVLRHWAPGTGFTGGETFDWLEDAETAEHYIKSVDEPIEPYWDGGDTEVCIYEHIGGGQSAHIILYDSAMVSEVI